MALALAAAPAGAGPPFVSDDPEPTDPGHWEIYAFTAGSHVSGETAGQAGLDINYGGAKDLQLTMVVPLDYEHRSRTRAGPGDIELAAKYRVLHQGDGSPLPDIAFFPRMFVPTEGRSFGTRRARLFLPLWAQKDLGGWSLFGGGGYQINPGPDQRDFWLEGAGLSRTLGKRLLLGAEIYHNSPDARDARAYTAVNFGGAWRLAEHWSLLASGGPGIQHARNGGRYGFYFSLTADY